MGSQELSDFKRGIYQNKTLMLLFLLCFGPWCSEQVLVISDKAVYTQIYMDQSR